jgi:hypothetical protein
MFTQRETEREGGRQREREAHLVGADKVMELRDHFQGADQAPFEQINYGATSLLTYVHVQSPRLVGMVNLTYIYVYVCMCCIYMCSYIHTFINI